MKIKTRVSSWISQTRNAGRSAGLKRPDTNECQRQADAAAAHDQHRTFNSELPDKPHLTGAERRTQGKLALARGTPCKEQIRHVGARNQQDESDGA